MRRVVNSLFIALVAGVAWASQPATQPGFRIGRIESAEIRESSGIIESRQHAGVFWTHNDSGNDASIFAITRTGRLLGSFDVEAPNRDWEDIATDASGALYIADIGNNTRKRTSVQVYRVPEPNPTTSDNTTRTSVSGRSGEKPRKIKPAATYELTYPAAPFDAEALFVHGEHGYIVEKRADFQRARVYRFSLKITEKSQEMELFWELPVRSPVTAADISRDGRYVAIITVMGPQVLEVGSGLEKLPEASPSAVRFLAPKMEAGCFVEEGVLATTEDGDVLLFGWDRFSPAVAGKQGDRAR